MIDRVFDNRTSLIIDPPDGRIPALTAAGRARQEAWDAAMLPPAGPEDLSTALRCITWGVPRLGGNFGSGPYSFYQIVQTPKYVVLLMEGSNDVTDRDIALLPAAIANLRQMLRTAKGRGLRPYLATIPPQNPKGFRGAFGAGLVPAFDDQVRSLAASESVPLVDVYQALNTDIGTFIGPDGMHPTVAGYAKIADVFFASIMQTLEVPAPTTVRAPRTSGAMPRGPIRGSTLPRVR